MKVFLFGASGQLGQEWQNYLTDFDEQETLFIPYTSSQLDITRPADVRHELVDQEPDIIINCAAYTKVDDAEDEHKKAMTVNAEAVGSLAKLCKELDIKLVHFSTDYVFAGKEEDRQRFPEGYPEDNEADPVNWYGQTKWEGEQAVRNSACRYLIMRVSWLCGAHGSNFVKTMLRLADNHSSLRIVDDQIGSPTFTYNLVRNTYQLLEQGREGTYHCSSAGTISWADFAEAIFEMADIKIEVERIPSSEYPMKAKRPFFSKLSTKKIEQIDGINIENWKTGLQHLLKEI